MVKYCELIEGFHSVTNMKKSNELFEELNTTRMSRLESGHGQSKGDSSTSDEQAEQGY